LALSFRIACCTVPLTVFGAGGDVTEVSLALRMRVRRFPPPWSVEETDACFIVRDKNGQALAYVYFEEEPGRRAAAHLLTRDEARRIAANIAKLLELLRRAVRHQKLRARPAPAAAS
jgi:hypothetical protein